jgi:hypothetical protein
MRSPVSFFWDFVMSCERWSGDSDVISASKAPTFPGMCLE